MREHQIGKAVFKYEDKFDKLSNIKNSYKQELSKITAEEAIRDYQ